MSTRSAAARKSATTHRRRTAPARPRPARRMSGPAGGVRGARASAAAAIAPRGVALPRPSLPRPHLVHAARGFSLRRTLDRLLRGRAWIALLTALLLGIVFMQVHMLKLNAGISRAVETAGTLERQNAQLRQQVSQLGASDRIEDAAAQLGMTMPAPGSVRYLDAGDVEVDAKRAASTMTAPDPTAAAQAAQAAAPAETTAPVVTQDPAAAQTPAAAQAPATTQTPAATQTPAVTQTPAATPQPQQQPAAAPTQASAQVQSGAATGTTATATGGAAPVQP